MLCVSWVLGKRRGISARGDLPEVRWLSCVISKMITILQCCFSAALIYMETQDQEATELYLQLLLPSPSLHYFSIVAHNLLPDSPSCSYRPSSKVWLQLWQCCVVAFCLPQYSSPWVQQNGKEIIMMHGWRQRSELPFHPVCCVFHLGWGLSLTTHSAEATCT